jgi:hypothetical protein
MRLVRTFQLVNDTEKTREINRTFAFERVSEQ